MCPYCDGDDAMELPAEYADEDDIAECMDCGQTWIY